MTPVVTFDIFFFFFKQKTAYEVDFFGWSSDVVLSDPPRPPFSSVSIKLPPGFSTLFFFLFPPSPPPPPTPSSSFSPRIKNL